MKKAALLAILSVVVVEAGCMMGPNYKRPTVSVPTGYRSAMPDQPAAAASLGIEKWWDVYQDPVLADLIHTALQQNYDVGIAAALVASVATAYFQLRALDSQLEISKRTLASRQRSLKLTEFLESRGSNSGLDVSQSQQLVYTSSETIPDLERQIQQQENLLSILF